MSFLSINVKQRLLTVALNSILIIRSLPAPTGKVGEFHVVWKVVTGSELSRKWLTWVILV